jgi:hypothetical protein
MADVIQPLIVVGVVVLAEPIALSKPRGRTGAQLGILLPDHKHRGALMSSSPA